MDAFEILVIILSAFLAIFLIISIIVAVMMILLIKRVNRLTESAKTAVYNWESLTRVAGKLSIPATILGAFFKIFKSSDKE